MLTLQRAVDDRIPASRLRHVANTNEKTAKARAQSPGRKAARDSQRLMDQAAHLRDLASSLERRAA